MTREGARQILIEGGELRYSLYTFRRNQTCCEEGCCDGDWSKVRGKVKKG